ncbi:MAG: CDP-alcohol phosphatidyltransferase family protein [Rhodospirillaceae bacterium]|jgi:phosphatidylglycerophosphate synthase
MALKMPPWDQRIARILVKPLVKTPIAPNHLTWVSLIVALTGCWLIAQRTSSALNWGVGLFVLSRFLDHFDGELARQKKLSSKFGYYFDYITGTVSYSALFICLGIGLHQAELGGTALGNWALILGIAGAISSVSCMFISFDLDKSVELDDTHDAIGYPGFAGLELEDGMYLIAPITWLGFLPYFFVLACIGSVTYLIYCSWRLRLASNTKKHDHKHNCDDWRNNGTGN